MLKYRVAAWWCCSDLSWRIVKGYFSVVGEPSALLRHPNVLFICKWWQVVDQCHRSSRDSAGMGEPDSLLKEKSCRKHVVLGWIPSERCHHAEGRTGGEAQPWQPSYYSAALSFLEELSAIAWRFATWQVHDVPLMSAVSTLVNFNLSWPKERHESGLNVTTCCQWIIAQHLK